MRQVRAGAVNGLRTVNEELTHTNEYPCGYSKLLNRGRPWCVYEDLDG